MTGFGTYCMLSVLKHALILPLYLHQVCHGWVRESHNWAESSAKQHLVDKFEKDLDKYTALLYNNPLVEDNDQAMHQQEVEYDKYRQEGHESLLIDIVNRMGNRMVDWYNQDYTSRMRSLSLTFQPPPGGPARGPPARLLGRPLRP